MSKFAEVIEEIKELSPDEKEEVFFLLEKYLVEERREEIFRKYIKSKSRKKHTFSSNLPGLKKSLNA